MPTWRRLFFHLAEDTFLSNVIYFLGLGTFFDSNSLKDILTKGAFMTTLIISTIVAMVLALMILSLIKIGISVSNNPDEL